MIFNVLFIIAEVLVNKVKKMEEELETGKQEKEEVEMKYSEVNKMVEEVNRLCVCVSMHLYVSY